MDRICQVKIFEAYHFEALAFKRSACEQIRRLAFPPPEFHELNVLMSLQ